MGNITIKLPKKLRLKHLNAYIHLANENLTPLQKMVKVVSCLSEVKEKEVEKIVVEDLIFTYKSCITIMSREPLGELQKVIEIDGKEYELINPIKQPISWVIDANGLVQDNNPEMIAALMYLPKGTHYGELDIHKNILYSVVERSKLFNEHLSIDVHYSLTLHFAKAIKEINEIFGNDKAVDRVERASKYGWENLILELSKHFSLNFHETMMLNVRTFKHYVDVYHEALRRKLNEAKSIRVR
jgi:hypothetical protein